MQFQDQAFWVRRNDIDILVLPVRFVEEIRNYTREQLSGIEALAFVSFPICPDKYPVNSC